MMKVGISGQPIQNNGQSPRANPQVAELNKDNLNKYKAVIVEHDLSRKQALELEQKITDKYAARNDGLMPSGIHKKPEPQVQSIAEYEKSYGKKHNQSTAGRY